MIETQKYLGVMGTEVNQINPVTVKEIRKGLTIPVLGCCAHRLKE